MEQQALKSVQGTSDSQKPQIVKVENPRAWLVEPRKYTFSSAMKDVGNNKFSRWNWHNMAELDAVVMDIYRSQGYRGSTSSFVCDYRTFKSTDYRTRRVPLDFSFNWFVFKKGEPFGDLHVNEPITKCPFEDPNVFVALGWGQGILFMAQLGVTSILGVSRSDPSFPPEITVRIWNGATRTFIPKISRCL